MDFFRKITTVAVAVTAAFSLPAATSDPLDTVHRQPVPKWSWNVNASGELKVSLGGGTYALATRMSYPNMPADGWNRIPGSTVRVSKEGESVIVDFTCAQYALRRVVAPAGHRLTVKDTYKNLSKEDVAIAFDTILTPSKVIAPENILLAGCVKPGSAPLPSSPAQNSSIFFKDAASALALVLEDDYYRLQAALKKDAGRGIVENRSFALAPNDSYTFEYSLYPTGSGDYWDFLNRMRQDWKLNTTIEGNLIFTTCPHPQLINFMPDVLKNALVNCLGAKYICGTNYTWFGQPSFWLMPGSKSFMAEYVSREEQLKKLQRAVRNAAGISPNLSVVAKIQTVFAAPPQPVGQPLPHADSVIIEADGQPKRRLSKSKDGQLVGYVNLHYPMIGNSYYEMLTGLINKAMDAGIKSIYFDTFCYSFWSHYGRWTYDRWDGHTVDMDTATWTIAKKKADLAVLASDAQVAMNELIRKRGGKMLFNSTPTTRRQISLLQNCVSFTESTASQLPITQHASHPVNLGYYPGYQYRKDAWKTPKDYYENVMENLEYGCLTYIYWMVGKLPTAPTIYQRMYPITIKRLYAGCVEGEERIVTRRSGLYSFGTGTEPKIYVYDKEGVESEATAEQAKCQTVDGKVVVTLTLPEGGAAVLEKQTDVRDCLAAELEF